MSLYNQLIGKTPAQITYNIIVQITYDKVVQIILYVKYSKY